MHHALPQVQDPAPIQRAKRFRIEPGDAPWLRLYEDDTPYGLPMEDWGEVVQHIALTAEHVVRELHAERTCLHSASATIDGRLALFSGPLYTPMRQKGIVVLATDTGMVSWVQCGPRPGALLDFADGTSRSDSSGREYRPAAHPAGSRARAESCGRIGPRASGTRLG
jgi:hypothetical protein